MERLSLLVIFWGNCKTSLFFSLIVNMVHFLVLLQNRPTFITKLTDFAMKVDQIYKVFKIGPISQLDFKKRTDFTIIPYILDDPDSNSCS
jgi:hypothetical protein